MATVLLHSTEGKLFVRLLGIPIQSCIPNLKPLAQAVFEILRSKRIGVTSLTFQGHVTSSVTWPFDSPYTISYWWFFGNKPLSLTVSEIFNVKCNALVTVTLIRHLNKGQGHSFWYQSISHIRLPNNNNNNHFIQRLTDGRLVYTTASHRYERL